MNYQRKVFRTIFGALQVAAAVRDSQRANVPAAPCRRDLSA
jgi:hypothetical protein